MFQFSAMGLLGLVAFAICWALAVVLFRVGASGTVTRSLSLLLFVEGVTLASTGYIDAFLSPATQAHPFYPAWLRAEEIVHTVGDCAMLALYPCFLAAALQTRLTRPFEKRQVRMAVYWGAALLCLATLFTPLQYGATALYIGLTALFLYALVASIHAWQTAVAKSSRERARAFALAFGIRDICWCFVYATAIYWIYLGTYEVADTDPSEWAYIIYALGSLLAVPLIAYGILRAHLFDIDLRVRWTIKQSTLAAVAVTIVFVLSEGADRFLSAQLGNFVGLLAAAIVIFFLAPLQRFAERVASAAMPNTQDTPEYAAFRKLQVYEASLIDASLGGISAKERALLETLRESLGVSAEDAEAIERELLSDEKPIPQ